MFFIFQNFSYVWVWYCWTVNTTLSHLLWKWNEMWRPEMHMSYLLCCLHHSLCSLYFCPYPVFAASVNTFTCVSVTRSRWYVLIHRRQWRSSHRRQVRTVCDLHTSPCHLKTWLCNLYVPVFLRFYDQYQFLPAFPSFRCKPRQAESHQEKIQDRYKRITLCMCVNAYMDSIYAWSCWINCTVMVIHELVL